MKVLLPTKAGVRPTEVTARLIATPTLAPFSPELIEFVSCVSGELLADHTIRAFPELLVLAHWFRPAELTRLRIEFEKDSTPHRRVPRGVVLHLAPSNVDVMFVYPWFLALLLGNLNIVRVSRRHGAAADALLTVVSRVLDRSDMGTAARRSLVVTYDHEEDSTSNLSELCDVRMIWGSDETVRTIRAIPLPVRATEIAFSDRFSLALLGAESIASLTDADLQALAHKFSNDSLWFDQRACSSPRAVIWLGKPERIPAAQRRFWSALGSQAMRHRSLLQPAIAIERFSAACRIAATVGGELVTYDHAAGLARVQVRELEARHRAAHHGGGLFLEAQCEDARGLGPWLRPEDQTLVHFGVDSAQLEELADLGLDRIVPIGDALKFETTWDGTNLMSALTRERVLRVDRVRAS